VSLSAYPCHYSKAFASDSIPPPRSIRLAPTPGIRPPGEHTGGYFVPSDHLYESLEFHSPPGLFEDAVGRMLDRQPLILCLLAPACHSFSLGGHHGGSDVDSSRSFTPLWGIATPI